MAVVVAIAVAVLLGAVPLRAQDRPELAAEVEAWVDANQGPIVAELVEWLSLPNVAADVEGMRANARALLGMLERRGIDGEILDFGGPPIVVGDLPAPGGSETTLLLYFHYDGQPVDPAAWTQPDPFVPQLRTGRIPDGAEPLALEGRTRFEPEWRLYARSASDDKSPIVAALAALDALRAAGAAPTVNLKFIFEGDEEAGSEYLGRVIREHGERLAADLAIMVDGPEHPSLRPTIVHGLRGITSARVVVYGADRPLHSGHYGNWAPNPAIGLARLLATMKDDEGRVTIAGWYDDVVPLGEEAVRAIARIPPERPGDYAFAEPEGGPDARRLERIALPSLNVRGLESGWVGAQARTIVPDSAVAEIDMRLVPEVQPEDQVRRLIDHIRAQGFHVVREPPARETRARYAPRLAWVLARDGGYPATRTPLDHPAASRVRQAMGRWLPEAPVVMPMMGGSAPAVWFPELAGIPVILLPIVNPDNNQHSPDENLRLGNFFDGIVTLAAVMRM